MISISDESSLTLLLILGLKWNAPPGEYPRTLSMIRFSLIMVVPMELLSVVGHRTITLFPNLEAHFANSPTTASIPPISGGNPGAIYRIRIVSNHSAEPFLNDLHHYLRTIYVPF